MVNSQFTSNQFVKTFFRLARIPRVVYPGIDLSVYTPRKIQEANRRLEAEEKATEHSSNDKGITSVKEGIRTLIETK